MNIHDNLLYQEDLDGIINSSVPWEKLRNKSILISGASGMIGKCLIDVIMKQNRNIDLNCAIYGIGRNKDHAKRRFDYCWNDRNFKFIACDVTKSLCWEGEKKIDFVLHMASNTHPVAYATDPIGTITTNIIGTYNLLEFAVKCCVERFAFASSNEIYGENRGDIDIFDENYCGYINSNTMRAGYPESKRCGETLCQAYHYQKSLDIVIPRLTRTYGPTMLMSDTKAISQFIRKGLNKENIVLKSEGNQYYSYTYVTDAAAGILVTLLCGKTCEAYNIADQAGDIMLKDLAAIVAELSGTNVVFEYPEENEKAGYSTATIARLNGGKLKQLGWNSKYDIRNGIKRTLNILNSVSSSGEKDE